MNPEDTTTRRYLIIGGVMFVLIMTLLIAFSHKPKTVTNLSGTVTLSYNTSDISNTLVHFNNQTIAPKATTTKSQTYSLTPGSYDVAVNNPGYNSFSTHFTVAARQNIIINIYMNLATTPSITSVQQLPLSSSLAATMSITNVIYFYNQTWAVVTIQDNNGNTGVIVVTYRAASATWAATLGPGTTFNAISIQALPSDVQQDLISNNYVNVEGS